MRVTFRPLIFFLGFLWFMSFISLGHEVKDLIYLDQVKTFEDKGVATFTPTSIYVEQREEKRGDSKHVEYVTETWYIVHYTGPNGYTYDVTTRAMEAAAEIKKDGPIQRRILDDTAHQTYMTIDGDLTVDEYIAQERAEGKTMIVYWVVLGVLLMGGTFLIIKKSKKL